MITKTYNLTLAGSKIVSKLTHAKDSRNAILAVDTSKLEGSKYDIYYKKYDDRLRFAKVESKSIVGIVIRSNSPDILITDISRDNTPYYYKAPVRFKNAEEVYVKGRNSIKDENFIYTTSSRGTVIYRIGNKEIEVEEDFYNVYLKESDHMSDTISKMDNKTYTYSIDTNGDYLISCTNPNIYFSTINGELSLISQYSKSNRDHLSFLVSEFQKDRKVKIGDEKIRLRYKSQEQISNIDERVNERVFLSDDVIQLCNSNVLPESVSITFHTGNQSVAISNIDELSVISNKGQILIYGISDSIPDVYDYITASYKFVSPRSNNIEIPIRVVNDSSIIKLYISPSEIEINGHILSTRMSIKIAAFDKLGICIYTNIHDLVRTPGVYNIYKDGETSLSSKIGVGGQYRDLDKVDILSIFELDKLESKVDGLLEVATIKKKDVELDFSFSSRQAVPLKHTHGMRKVYIPRLSYSKIIVGKNKIDSINSNVMLIDANMSTSAILTVYAKTDSYMDVVADVSKDFYTSTVEYVEDDSIQKFLNFKPPKFLDRDKEKYRLFASSLYESVEVKPIKTVIDGNLIYFRVSRDSLGHHDTISISYNDYPGIGVKI